MNLSSEPLPNLTKNWQAKLCRLATMIYLANLRRTKSACVLKNDFLCLLDGDWNGNLKEIQKQNLVFLKMLKCKNGEGNKQHLPLCLRDDRLPKFGCFFFEKSPKGGGVIFGKNAM